MTTLRMMSLSRVGFNIAHFIQWQPFIPNKNYNSYMQLCGYFFRMIQSKLSPQQQGLKFLCE